MIPKPWMEDLEHLLVSVDNDVPVAMEEVGALEIDLVPPSVALGGEEVDHGGLVVGFKERAFLQIGGEDLAGLDAGLAFRPHRSPHVEEVKRPLAIAEKEAASVEADPVVFFVHPIIPSVHDEVVVGVTVPGDLEGHVSKHGVTVHPPQELHLRVGEEERADQGELGPEAGHFGVEEGHVVEDLNAVDAAVVDLVLDGLEEVVVADRVLAGVGGGSGNEQHPGLAGAEEAHPIRVAAEPLGALPVPIGDHGPQRVGFRGVAQCFLVAVSGRATSRGQGAAEADLGEAVLGSGADGSAEEDEGEDEAQHPLSLSLSLLAASQLEVPNVDRSP